MGDRAKEALEWARNRHRKPVYRVQGQNPSPESLPKQEHRNHPKNTTTNETFVATEKVVMNNKPMIQCPHCGEITGAERLPSQRKYRNEFGLDVFECPDCHKNYKIEPREYLLAREHIEKGIGPGSVAIKGAKVDEILPSEKMAIDFDRRSRAPWRGTAIIIAIIAVLILAYAILK